MHGCHTSNLAKREETPLEVWAKLSRGKCPQDAWLGRPAAGFGPVLNNRAFMHYKNACCDPPMDSPRVPPIHTSEV
eukprot:Skav209690  [mRNA]  locus=scaffold2205:43041:43268:+ [translate_table: standard]